MRKTALRSAVEENYLDAFKEKIDKHLQEKGLEGLVDKSLVKA